MLEIKLSEMTKFAKVKLAKDINLICFKINDTYNLIKEDYSLGLGFEIRICENKKRLSTINKYAKEYNIIFVE